MSANPDLSELRAHCDQRRKCGIATALEQLGAKDREVLLVALEDPKEFSGAGISRWLNSKGVITSRWMVSAHRRKECSCA